MCLWSSRQMKWLHLQYLYTLFPDLVPPLVISSHVYVCFCLYKADRGLILMLCDINLFFWILTLVLKKKDKIREEATIYRKTAHRPLSKYQMHINAASVQLCLNNPTLLLNWRVLDLLELARSKVIEEGFVFAKGKSRSKIESIRSHQFKPHHYLNSHCSFKALEDKIKNHNDIVQYKEKQISECLSISNFSQCEELISSIINFKEVSNKWAWKGNEVHSYIK